MNFFLEDGDSINVLKKTGTIQVLGEVHRPGYITYNKSYNVKKIFKPLQRYKFLWR